MAGKASEKLYGKEEKKGEEKKPEKKAEEKPAEVKAEEVKKDGEPEKKVEAAPPVEVAPREPIEIVYKVRDGFTIVPEKKAALDGILQEFYATPTPETQQKLADFHFDLVQEALTDYRKMIEDSVGKTRSAWAREVNADPIIGGNNHDGAMQAMAYVRDNFVSLEPRGSKAYEAAKEGFPEMDGAQFVAFFCKLNPGCTTHTRPNRIEFEYVRFLP